MRKNGVAHPHLRRRETWGTPQPTPVQAERDWDPGSRLMWLVMLIIVVGFLALSIGLWAR